MFAALDHSSDAESDNESSRDSIQPLYRSSPAELLSRSLDILTVRETRPRGLLNQRNNCYLNAVLQSLFAFIDFRAVLQSLNLVLEYLDPETTPVCLALHLLYQQWLGEELTDSSMWKCQSIYPQSFEEILAQFSQDIGSHEDAHEFFHYLIDSLHEELSRLQKFDHNTTGRKSSSLAGFVAVRSRRKNRVVISFDETPITRLFCGRIRCLIHKKNSQHYVPFFSLQLSLDPSRSQSVRSLLSDFSSPVKLTARKEGKQIVASQTSLIDAFPQILVLHLKRFAFNGSNVQKIHNHVSFPDTLTFPDASLAKALKDSGHSYILRSVICHFGQSPARGHYTAYFHHAKCGWISADDNNVNQVKWFDVQHQQAYILFYELNKKHR